jgi:phosphomevalonate kinase
MFVLVSGRRYSGKDTFADLLTKALQERGIAVERTAFAAALKRAYAAANPGVDVQRLFTDSAYKEMHRPGLIAYGGAERSRDPDVWVKQALYTDEVRHADVTVVSDWRMANEKACVVREFADNDETRVFCVRVFAPDPERTARGWIYNAAIDNDDTETQVELSSCNDGHSLRWVGNGGSLETLTLAANALADEIFIACEQ